MYFHANAFVCFRFKTCTTTCDRVFLHCGNDTFTKVEHLNTSSITGVEQVSESVDMFHSRKHVDAANTSAPPAQQS